MIHDLNATIGGPELAKKKIRTQFQGLFAFEKRLLRLFAQWIWAPRDTQKEFRQCDVLFFSGDADLADSTMGLAYSRVLEPLRIVFQEAGYSVTSITYPGNRIVGSKTLGPVFSISRLVIRFEISMLIARGKRWFMKEKENTRRQAKQTVYERVIRSCDPEVICVIDADVALCLAAHETGVPILEILHGRGYGDVFEEWERRNPSELPDGVIAYDDLSAETFGRLLPTLRVPNFRLPFELEKARQFLNVSPPPFSEVPNHYRHVILFTASYNPKEPSWPGGLPTELVDLTLENGDIFLLVRMHPVMRLEPQYAKARQAIERVLRAVPNCDSEWASTAPIYAVLQHTTCHVTYQSTSSYEAADMGIVTYAIDGGKHIPTGDQYDLRKNGYVVGVDSHKAEFSRIIESPGKTRDARIDDEELKCSDLMRFAQASSGSRKNC